MKQILLMNKVLWKQYFYKHHTWLLMLLLAALFLRFVQPTDSGEGFSGLLVGVCASDEAGKELLERLQGREDGLKSGEGVFRFLGYDEQESMLRDVKNGTLECGYVLPEGFFEKLSEGKLHNRIILYYSDSSGAHKLSYEVVFSHLFTMLSEEILSDWLGESGIEYTAENAAAEWLLEQKELYESGEDTFSFEFEHVGNSRKQEKAGPDGMRGIIGVSIFFLGLLGLAGSYELSAGAGAFARHEARRMERTGVHIAVTGSVLAGGCFLLLAGVGTQPGKEVLGLGFYFVLLEVYFWILKGILRTREAVYGAIPVLLLGSILLCPVFFRIETFVPVVGYLGKAFPLYWYLNFFT